MKHLLIALAFIGSLVLIDWLNLNGFHGIFVYLFTTLIAVLIIEGVSNAINKKK